MSQQNLEIVRRLWKAYADDGINVLLDYYTEDCVVEDFPELPDRATYAGGEGIRERYRHFLETWGEFDIEPVEFINAGDAVVVTCEVQGHGKGSGTPFAAPVVFVSELRGGKVVRDRAFTSKSEALEAAGLPEQAALISEQNVGVVRESWDAWRSRHDVDGVLALYAPDVVWDVTQISEWPEGAYMGRAGVRRFLAEWLEVWDDFEVGVENILAAPDGRVVALAWQRGKGRHSGLTMNMEWVQIFTLREGQIIRVDNYDDRAKALAAAGLRQ